MKAMLVEAATGYTASTMPKTNLPDARVSPRFAGIATFGRYPRLEDVAQDHKPVDWVVYGVPYDGGVTYRPGARFGPRAIRQESQYLKRFHIEHAVDVCDVLSLADAGDAPVSPYDAHQNMLAQLEFARTLGERSPTRLMALGGDHSIAYANIRATWERQGQPKGGLALVHFDSHLDTVDAVWGEQWGHASVFRRAIEDGLIDGRRMLSVGIKGPLNTSSDLNFAREQGVTLLTYNEYLQRGPAALRKFVSRLKGAAAYITFDVDCVDPAFAPGTGTPSIGGLTSAQALDALRALRGLNVVGADVVEVLPDRDVSGITALLAAHVAFEIIALAAIQRGPKRRQPKAQTRKSPA